MRVAHVDPPKRLNSGTLLGFADITFSLTDGGDGCLKIRGFKIFKGKTGGVQIGLPSRKEKDQWYPLVSLDFENEDAKAFINHVTDEVAKVYNNPPAEESRQQTSTRTAEGSGGIADEDIPF